MLELAQKWLKLCCKSPSKNSSFKEVEQTIAAPNSVELPEQYAQEVLCQHS